MADKPITIRISVELLAVADALKEPLSADRTLLAVAGGELSRSAVLRLALVRGLTALENEYGGAGDGTQED